MRAGLASVAVAARVEAQVAATGVQGTERPVAGGAAVQLQRQAGASWTTVSLSTADAVGAWIFNGALQAGTYRVRCAPGRGFAAGVSASFQAP